MRAVGVVVLVGFAGASLVTLAPPRVAHACSAGPDFNPVVGHEVIVAGYVTDLEILGKRGVMFFLELEMTLEVDRYLWGSGPARLQVVDNASGVPPHELVPNLPAFETLDLTELDVDDLRYDGSGGACGALDEDPRDRYWVVGLSRHPDTGRLQMSRLATFAIGADADDAVVVEGVARVRRLLAEAGLTPLSANTGNMGLASGRSEVPSTASQLVAVLGALLLLSGARFVSGLGQRR